jgi:hypothetical protein
MRFELKGERCPYCNEDRMQGLVAECNNLFSVGVECSDCGYSYYLPLDSDFFIDVINLTKDTDKITVCDYGIPLREGEDIWNHDRELKFQEHKRAWEQAHQKPYFKRSEVMPQKKSKQVNVAITPETKDQWEYWAEKKGMTVAQFVRHCVSVYITAYEKSGKD